MSFSYKQKPLRVTQPLWKKPVQINVLKQISVLASKPDQTLIDPNNHRKKQHTPKMKKI